MNKITFIFSLMLLALCGGATTNYTAYCEGWGDGYPDGYCHREFNCIAPITPLCPLRTIEEQNTYKAGYQRGFRRGLKDAGKIISY